jgi:2-polyprenyl-3-methyl-5-hydroxy-6-metoxy-1,4-benzoquinol methylase
MKNCTSCGSQGLFLWKAKGYDFYKCKNKMCELIYADVMKRDLENIYEDDYYKEVYQDYESDKRFHLMNNNILLSKIERHFQVSDLLEIGSAFGFFIESARNRGWNALGVETSNYASKVAKEIYGNNVQNSDFLNENRVNSFDVVCMLGTIEHVLNPSLFIYKIANTLKPEGGVVITTPNIESLFAHIFKRKWRHIYPPYHISYFSPNSLSFLLQKYAFQVLSINCLGQYYNFSSIIQYLFGIDKKKVPSFPIWINLGDAMTVIAKKIK